MLALLLAASAALSPPQPTSPVAAETACRSPGAVQTSFVPDPALLLRPQDRASVRALKLGDLPKANYEIAVARTVGGCAAPIVVSTKVEGDGRFAGGGK